MRLVPAAAFLAAAAVALLPGCGPDPTEQAPAVRNMLREFSLAVVKKDDEKILSFVLPMAGQGDNPVGAQGWNTPEGKAAILEGSDVEDLDMSCFDGRYITGTVTDEYLAWVEGSQES